MTEDIFKIRTQEIKRIAEELGLDANKLKVCTEIIFEFINRDFSVVDYNKLNDHVKVNNVIANSVLKDIELSDLKKYATLHKIMVGWGITFIVKDDKLKLSPLSKVL